jgi:hypothetical protein
MASSIVLLGMLSLFTARFASPSRMTFASLSTYEKKKWNNMATGHAVAQLFDALHYKPGRSRVRLLMVSLEFFIDIIHPATLLPRGRLSF